MEFHSFITVTNISLTPLSGISKVEEKYNQDNASLRSVFRFLFVPILLIEGDLEWGKRKLL
jgi:hypothetical protein